MPKNEYGLLDLSEIEQRVDALAAKIGAPAKYLPDYGQSDGMAAPNIEVDWSYCWVVSERGTEYERRRTIDLDELLYWIFSSITFSMAVQFEVRHRIAGQDSRRLMFAHQLDLLERFDICWRAREQASIEEVLAEHPYNDSLPGS